MIKFNKEQLRDKIYACWLGKNIGGTLGAPFECQRNTNDCTGFTSKPGNPLPNDDLDLQLVWLKAMIEVGPEKLDSHVLGEYWLEYISPFWNEYGIGKGNMRRGLPPPISGQYNNYWKHSNGAWIRTEIWACLFPGNVEKAIKYAYEDACVDHGSGEGTYAAIFVAAIEAAAFIIDDLHTLIKIGLSKIPSTCKTHIYISKVLECYENKMDWRQTRDIITDMTVNDKELGWFQAPANLSYAVIGLVFGEGDFKKSLLISCNCGDDTDCSCATAGSILGIMHGTKIIPSDWKEYIGDSIITLAVAMGVVHSSGTSEYMQNCTNLTDTIMKLHPVTLRNTGVCVVDGQSEYSHITPESFMGDNFARWLQARGEYFVKYKSIIADCLVEYSKAPEISPNESISFKVHISNKFLSQKIFTFKWFLPEGWTVEGRQNINVAPSACTEFTVTAGEKVEAKNMLCLAVLCESSFDVITVPIVLLG